jgi:hypothetical protein
VPNDQIIIPEYEFEKVTGVLFFIIDKSPITLSTVRSDVRNLLLGPVSDHTKDIMVLHIIF